MARPMVELLPQLQAHPTFVIWHWMASLFDIYELYSFVILFLYLFHLFIAYVT